MAGSPRIVPLLVLIFPEKIFLFSTIDICISNFSFEPHLNKVGDLYRDATFTANILSTPSVGYDFDVYNPDIVVYNVSLNLNNNEQLQDYGFYYPLESCDCIYVEYDYINQVELRRVVGKLFDISFERNEFSFTLKSIGDSYFSDEPVRVLEKDTFQTVHTFGPLEGNILSHIGLLVDIAPADTTEDSSSLIIPVALWPTNITPNDQVRSLVTFIQDDSLINADDNYWVGSLVVIAEDPLLPHQYVERSDRDSITGGLIVGSPYTGWPTSYDVPGGVPEAYLERPLRSSFCLGSSAYVLRGADGDNANVGKLWLDVRGPELLDWTNPADPLRQIPSKYRAVPDTPAQQYWSHRMLGARNMGSLAQRHILRVYRRNLPEGSNSVGSVFPIAYGWVYKGKAVHAIGVKAMGTEQGAGSDYYIICGHRMAFRVNTNSALYYEERADRSWNEELLQFQEAFIWHSLEKFPTTDERAEGPYLKNINEFGPMSLNPFPRARVGPRTWVGAAPSYVAGVELEPIVMWFNAGEDHAYRYPFLIEDLNRQMLLADNKNNVNYSGIKLRGDEYWQDVSESGAATPAEAINNAMHPQSAIAHGLGGAEVYLDFAGHPDYDDGFITGIPSKSIAVNMTNIKTIENPAGLITHPADIIVHYLLKYTELNNDRNFIDWESFRKTRGQLFGWRFSVFKSGDQSGEDFITNILKQCRCSLININGRWVLRYIDLDTNRKISYVFNDENIIHDTLSINRPEFKSLYSTIKVNYKYYRPHDNWEDVIIYDCNNNYDCSIAKQLYGVSETLVMDCDCISEWSFANQLALYLVNLYSKPRFTIQFKALLDNHNKYLEPGDMVVVQSRILPDHERLLGGIVDSSRVRRELFVITKISISDGLLNIELLQLLK
jgi:hypothetical protein